MKVKLLSHTPEPEKVISMAAKLCYSAVESRPNRRKLNTR